MFNTTLLRRHVRKWPNTLYLDGCPIQNAESIDILGVIFSIKSDFDQHVDSRTAKCRHSSCIIWCRYVLSGYYALSDVGMCYPDIMHYLILVLCYPGIMHYLMLVMCYPGIMHYLMLVCVIRVLCIIWCWYVLSGYYALSDIGMCYPGIMSDAKSYLYRSICQPNLMYGLDAINLSAPILTKLQNTLGSIMKKSLWHSETFTPHAVTACPWHHYLT